MRKTTLVLSFLVCTFSGLGALQAQSINQALELYKAKEYPDAAMALYAVMSEHPELDIRDQAQIYLAETLFKMDLLVPAFSYYEEIFKVGRSNRYYLNAVEGLLKVQKKLHDPLLVPTVLSTNFDGEGFNQLDPDKVAQISYLVGYQSFNQARNSLAREYLEFVPPESLYYGKARYLLGLIEIRNRNSEVAVQHFEEVVSHIPEDSVFEELRRIRGVALLAMGRTLYGMGKYPESSTAYGSVPRFTEQWFSAMYENAWAFYKQGDYGRALGELHSVTSPYMSKSHIPEAYVIQGTAYFNTCQWDRVRRSIELYNKTYVVMRKSLEGYLGDVTNPSDYYNDLVAGGNQRYPEELAGDIRKAKRFRDFYFMMDHMAWESNAVSEMERWSGTRLAQDVKSWIDDYRAQLEVVIGSWVAVQLKTRLANLKDFQEQIDTLDTELSIAETMWLDEAREIEKGRRARLPRPKIPNDQWQHWNFRKEYWKGELGYYQHALGDECQL